jgi:hypothetical protein
MSDDTPGCMQVAGLVEDSDGVRTLVFGDDETLVIRDLVALLDTLGLVEGPVDSQVDPALSVLSSACNSDSKLWGIRGRMFPSFPRVMPLNSSDTKVKAMSSVP